MGILRPEMERRRQKTCWCLALNCVFLVVDLNAFRSSRGCCSTGFMDGSGVNAAGCCQQNQFQRKGTSQQLAQAAFRRKPEAKYRHAVRPAVITTKIMIDCRIICEISLGVVKTRLTRHDCTGVCLFLGKNISWLWLKEK